MDEVVVDKDKLMEYITHFDKIETMEIPEFRQFLGAEDCDKVPVIKLRGASLDDHMKAQSLNSVPLLIYRFILKRYQESKYFDVDKVEEALKDDTLLPNTRFEISLFHRNVIEPNFTMENVIEISEVYPDVVNRVVRRILGITQEHSND